MRHLAASLALATFVFAGTARAQDPPPPPEKPLPPDKQKTAPDTPEKRKELHRRIMALRMARLTQELDLDEATAAKLFPLINRHDEKVSGLVEDRAKALQDMGAALKSDKADALAPLLDKVTECEKAIHEADETVHKKVREVLTPKQMAQFLIFHEKFHDEVRGLLEDSKHEKGEKHGGEIDGLLKKAEACIKDGHLDDAAMVLGKAIEMAPDAVHPYLMRAQVNAARHQLDDALRDAKHAVGLAPGKADPILLMAHLLAEKGDKESAVRLLKDYIAKADGPGADEAKKLIEQLTPK